MKYVAIFAIIVFLFKIDFWLGLIDKASTNIESARTPVVEVNPEDIQTTGEIIPVAKDASLKQTPRQTFLALLEDFHSNPVAPIRERAIAIFKDHPTMFTTKLDPELESNIFRWRELLNNNEPEAVNFLVDLLNILQGENQLMVKRFFALWMEINMDHFIAAYSRTKDSNCTIATMFGDPIPEEEKLNEYYDREDALKSIVNKEKIEPAHKALATNCLLVLGIEIAKIAPQADPNTAPVVTPDIPEGGVSP